MNKDNDDLIPNFDFGIFEEDRDNSISNCIGQQEIDNYILKQKAKSTTSKEITDYNQFKRYCKTINENREIDTIPEKQLDNILCQFFMNAKTVKGTLYEPDTLTGFRNSFQRILNSRKSSYDLKIGIGFQNSRKILSSRRKELTKLGKGNKPNATRPLTDQEVNYLYDTGYFGIENPTSLQRTVWWIITKHFGQRARNEARQLKFGDIKLETEFESGSEYLVWDIERCTKTRTGECPMAHKRAFKPKAFENKTDRCPVKIYKIFVSHRPPTMLLDQSPFFLGVRYRLYFKSDVWYLNKPLGKNSIGDFLSKASKILPQSSCSSRKVSNHSARKTCITNLLNENVNPLYVSQLSCHKKLESLQSYNQASMNSQKHMSNILGDTDSRNLRNSQSTVTQEQEIPMSIQQQLLNNWNPVLPSTFHGALISNCTFNINVYNNSKSPPSKRRRVIIEDDSQ